MLSILYLITLTIAGLAVVQRVMPSAPTMVRLCGGFFFGLVASAWITYAVAFGLSPATDNSLLIGILATLAVHGAVIGVWGRGLRPGQFKLSWFEVLFIGASLAFSFWLMDQRLMIAHNLPDSPLLVSSETWGDTALHTALSKSFSAGANYPTEYPFFANDPIKYHFGFDFFAGVLQKGGLSVLLSFNLPGALGFTAMMMLLFSLGRMLFGRGEETMGHDPHWWRDKGVWVGLIAVALLLTNQSLGFLRYIDHPLGKDSAVSGFWAAIKPANLWHHQHYLTIGPYDPQEKIAIFNTLNVYLTQTHLIVGMAVVLFVAFGLLQPLRRGTELTRNRMLLLGVMFGLAFWLNGVLWIAAGVFFGTLLVVFALLGAYRHAQTAPVEERLSQFAREFWRWTRQAAWFIVPALALGIPQSVWLNGGLSNGGADTGRSIQLHLGYLVCSAANSGCHGHDASGHPQLDLLNLSDWKEFFNYWLLNEGLVLPLLAVAAVIGRRFDKKVLLAVMAVFILGNTVQLSRDLGGHNHKVINLWENLSGLFVGYALVEVATFGYASAARISRLKATLRAPSLEPGLAALLGSLVALGGVAVALIGYALPWFATPNASVSALNLTFSHWTAGATLILLDRPALAILPVLALLATVDAVASLATSGRGSAWPRAAAGLGLAVLGAAFAIFIKADVPGSQVRLGAYLTMLGGGIVLLSAAIRPDFRIRIDVDPFRGLALALCAVAFAVLVASGLVDFMTVKNDFKVRVFGDPPEPEAIQWIQDNTPKDAVFLTNWDDLYTVPTLAGRSVFLGYSPWAGSAGYQVAPRQQTITQIYSAADKTTACSLLEQNQINYVMISSSERSGNHFKLNEALFKNQFKLAGAIPQGGDAFTVYDVKQSCGAAVSASP
jgi:hypothetical protein